MEESLAELTYDKEGFMLFDSENTDVRVKCKGDAYVKVKNMKGNDRNKRYGLLKKVLQNTETDYLRRFAEDYDKVKELEFELKGLVSSILYYYKNVRVNKINGYPEAFIPDYLYSTRYLFGKSPSR